MRVKFLINLKKKEKESVNLENDFNCLTQTNIVRFLKFKSLKKADSYLFINIVGAYLHTIFPRLHCTDPEGDYLDFSTCILFI